MKAVWRSKAGGALVLTVPALASAACPLGAADGTPIQSPEVQVGWRAEPTPIRVGQPFALLMQVCPAGARIVRVDAVMPAHRHGMNYKPTLQALAHGRWRAQGLLWHMSGRWELRMEVETQGQTRLLTQVVELP